MIGLNLPGFPRGKEQDEVRFHFAKSLPYHKRIFLAFFCLIAGLVIQILTLNVILGVPFIAIGVGLVLARGYDSRARLKSFSLDPNWTKVPIERVQEIEKLETRIKRWDKDALDVSNFLGGCMMFVWTGIGIIVALLLGIFTESFRVGLIVAVDTILIVIPMWFTGMRFVLRQSNLGIRSRIVVEQEKVFRAIKRKGEEFNPALQLARDRDGKTVPKDARFSISFPSPPEGFFGLQAQININVVQGSSYPYFYCVLAAKPGFGLGAWERRIKETNKILVEYQEDDQAEVIVIRRRTTKKSGYSTDTKIRRAILELALDVGRMICAPQSM